MKEVRELRAIKESARRTENGELVLIVHPKGLSDAKKEPSVNFMQNIV